jgi:hypothetical protein
MTEQTFTPEVISENEVTDTLFVTLEGTDYQRPIEHFGLTIQSTEAEILRAIAPAIQEQFHVDVSQDYKVRKAEAQRNLYVIPSSVAG